MNFTTENIKKIVANVNNVDLKGNEDKEEIKVQDNIFLVRSFVFVTHCHKKITWDLYFRDRFIMSIKGEEKISISDLRDACWEIIGRERIDHIRKSIWTFGASYISQSSTDKMLKLPEYHITGHYDSKILQDSVINQTVICYKGDIVVVLNGKVGDPDKLVKSVLLAMIDLIHNQALAGEIDIKLF